MRNGDPDERIWSSCKISEFILSLGRGGRVVMASRLGLIYTVILRSVGSNPTLFILAWFFMILALAFNFADFAIGSPLDATPTLG